MIEVTRLQGAVMLLNADKILYVERTPDTTIVCTTGERFMVRETPAELVDRVVAYRRRIHQPVPPLAVEDGAERPATPQGRTPRSEPPASEGPAGEFTSPLTGPDRGEG